LGLHVAAWKSLQFMYSNSVCAGFCPDRGHFSGTKSISLLINEERSVSARYQKMIGVGDMEIALAICGDLTCWTASGGWRPQRSPSE
jgi:hypothetical protein